MLSQSNIDKLVITGLYKHEIPEPDTGYGHEPTWCKNWTFTVLEDDGQYWMRDTYWSSSESLSFKLTDDNFDEFSLILDFDKVIKTNKGIWEEYPEDKRFWAPTDSGGTYCGGSYFILKGAKPSRELKREILLADIHSIESKLEFTRYELDRLDADGMGGFYE
jgi:hypothetical protein